MRCSILSLVAIVVSGVLAGPVLQQRSGDLEALKAARRQYQLGFYDLSRTEAVKQDLEVRDAIMDWFVELKGDPVPGNERAENAAILSEVEVDALKGQSITTLAKWLGEYDGVDRDGQAGVRLKMLQRLIDDWFQSYNSKTLETKPTKEKLFEMHNLRSRTKGMLRDLMHGGYQ